MKILKLLLSLGVGSSVSANTNLLSNNQSTNYSSKYNQNGDINVLTNWYENSSQNNRDDIENYINSHEEVNDSTDASDGKVNYKITDDFSSASLTELVNKQVITNQIKDILLSSNYLINLDQLVDSSNIITINSSDDNYSTNDVTNILNYDGDDNQNITTNSYSTSKYKIWAIAHWYWFGYWKVCINHPLSQKIAGMLLEKPSADDIGQTLEPYTEDSSPNGTANAIAALLIIQGLIISQNDFGQGVWIGFYLLVPDMGWGSLGGYPNKFPKFKYNRIFWDYCGGWGHELDVYHTYNILDYTNYGSFSNYIKLHPQFQIPNGQYAVYCTGDNMVPKDLYNNWTDWSSIKFGQNKLLGSYTGQWGLAKYFSELHLTWLNQNNKIKMQYHYEANNADCFFGTSAWISYKQIDLG